MKIPYEAQPPAIEARAIRLELGGKTILDRVDLTVAAGELVALLGPSGSGKTSFLRVLAGFLTPNSGELAIAGRPSLGVPAECRDLPLVFQDLRLFPHLSVEENIAFGLRVRGLGARKARLRVRALLERFQLAEVAEQRPSRISGGQAKRVALARALAIEPSALLLDEPLSGLDAALRDEMRSLLRQIHRQEGTTLLLVTHDQAEALALSDRIVLLRAGRVEQAGAPRDLYREPATAWVAGFLGGSNLWRVGPPSEALPGTWVIKPEDWQPASPDESGSRIICTGTIDSVEFLGAATRVRFRTPAQPGVFSCLVGSQAPPAGVPDLFPGARLGLRLRVQRLWKIPDDPGVPPHWTPIPDPSEG
jgi:ABC-type Fe3+/spermidine/putrescine transport system ATPase subunit